MRFVQNFVEFLITEGYKELKVYPTSDIKKNYNLITQAINYAVSKLSGDNELGGKTFLLEIAMTESMLGTTPGTTRTSGSAGRGVWQFDEIAFKKTKDIKSHPMLAEYHKLLKERINLDWNTVQWNDCNYIVIGAIAARLYLATLAGKIPERREDRADYWKSYYNTNSGSGTADQYWERVANCLKKIGVADKYTEMSYAEASEI